MSQSASQCDLNSNSANKHTKHGSEGRRKFLSIIVVYGTNYSTRVVPCSYI